MVVTSFVVSVNETKHLFSSFARYASLDKRRVCLSRRNVRAGRMCVSGSLTSAAPSAAADSRVSRSFTLGVQIHGTFQKQRVYPYRCTHFLSHLDSRPSRRPRICTRTTFSRHSSICSIYPDWHFYNSKCASFVDKLHCFLLRLDAYNTRRNLLAFENYCLSLLFSMHCWAFFRGYNGPRWNFPAAIRVNNRFPAFLFSSSINKSLFDFLWNIQNQLRYLSDDKYRRLSR